MLTLAVIAVLALFIYLGALKIGQMLAGREFAAALAGDPETNRPIILFLRSFEIAQSSLGSRILMFLSDMGLSEAIMMVRYVVRLDSEALPAGTTDIVLHRTHEIEENLDEAIALNAMFVALGDPLASYGAAKNHCEGRGLAEHILSAGERLAADFHDARSVAKCPLGALADHVVA